MTFPFNGSGGKEIYYRFCVPDTNNMHVFEAGEKYVLSGKIKLSITEETKSNFISVTAR
jgi:hypothetical protein